ncbi:Vegetative incompatibility protein HET-E-1 [Ceratobasidium theobromae]|uniref:Vegetative incompatibility protein HET-E-1 n=1 Tax=Ceratobasidium theobromae TaxID=1582974 RepID=A0A5N5QV66_9AGAM|nr:Vegetative incompatibility protein HET-E-1 [Ceratobasidium theobromae]
MSSRPPPDDPPRKGVRSIIQGGFLRVKQALKPSRLSRSPSPANLSRPFSPSLPVPPNPPAAITPQGTQSPSSHPTPPPIAGANVTSSSPSTVSSPKPGKLDITWSALEKALQVLEKNLGIFPPLKSAVGELVSCLDIIQGAAENSKDYELLAGELRAMAETLNEYVGELGSEGTGGSIARVAKAIKAQAAYIDAKRNRAKGERIFGAREDKEDILDCHHQIKRLFRQLQSDLAFKTFRNTNEQLVMTLLQRLSAVDDARYNSSYSTTIKRRECTPRTREKVQEDLQAWANDPYGPKIYWMNGMAGTGKTTLAYSLCKWLEDNKQLGASFFCSRASASCRSLRGIVPTIAYQLARYSPAFRSELCRALKDDPDASMLHVVTQFEKLIQGPLSNVKDAIPEGVVIVIDALDECEDNYGVRLILELLLKFVANLPIKFFVASRPEPTIREMMMSSSSYSPSVMHLHDIEESIVQEDIKKYLVEALSRMSPPPSQAQIDELGKRAGKLFIYAATVARYIYPGHIRVNSGTRLERILAIDSNQSNRDDPSKRYEELDRLYFTVLDAAFDQGLERDELGHMQLMLWTVVCAREPMTIKTLGLLLSLSEEQVLLAVEPLRAVLHVSNGGGLVSTLHASFTDYMLDKSRSASSCVFDKDVPDLDKRINDVVSPTLFYACRYWSEHLQQAEASKEISDMLSEFLSQRLLFWMEVMSLRKCIGSGVPMLHQAQIWLSMNKLDDGTQKQASDARIFVTGFAANACSHSTPHIYISALPFCPKSSTVYANYWGRTQGLMSVGGTALKRREAAALAIWKGDGEINSVSFSPDGARVAIASGSDIWVRDAHTGRDVAGPFKGHTDSVNSVVFSPDGARIVSGSDDCTIRVWESHTGAPVADPFEGHTDLVHTVAFSPDGASIVSGSYDHTIRVWESHTGAPAAGPFEGHTDLVKSVAFSPDGTRIVSGSSDYTIRVWESHTGASVVGPFHGHTDGVNSVAFSPDGARIVSGSDDHTIRVWESHTGVSIAGPFQGHTGLVKSVAFSPDGTRIVSGSDDRTIRVWESHTGALVAGPFQGHTDWVKSVAFSPDGARIVSGSYDHTIRVWESHTGASVAGPFQGHTDCVNSVAFSPDGTRIVSGSSDRTIRVWESHTGASVVGPFQGHTDGVNSVAFSPDGARIVSGSNDYTIRVWESHTGAPVAGPFQGHTHWVKSVAFCPDGARIVSGSYDYTVRVWESHTGASVAGPFQGDTDLVNSVAFSPDGARIVSGSYGHPIRVWESHTGASIAGPFQGHTRGVKSVAFSSDGARIVSGSSDYTIRVWESHTGASVSDPFQGHTGLVNSVAFSPDGTRIVSGSDDRTIRVWESHTGASVAGPFQGHTDCVNSVAFSPDGTQIVSGSDDCTIRVWDLTVSAARKLPKPSGEHLRANKSFTTPHNEIYPILSHDPHYSTICTSDPAQSSVLAGSWTLNDDGWVSNNNDQLLFWVTPDLHSCLPAHHNLLTISKQGSLQVEDWNLALGDAWSKCYVSD